MVRFGVADAFTTMLFVGDARHLLRRRGRWRRAGDGRRVHYRSAGLVLIVVANGADDSAAAAEQQEPTDDRGGDDVEKRPPRTAGGAASISVDGTTVVGTRRPDRPASPAPARVRQDSFALRSGARG
ncbi:hypothetical protein [Micromonospora psammae]|uniref:hypothetical protein n=1 Tax=Micromonospora sp. CPCC 205556 TaxID=3122398 RepID=UPI002FEF0742